MAQKLAEEATEVVIEAVRGDRSAVINESVVRGLVFRPPRTSAIAVSNSMMRSGTGLFSGRFFFARATLNPTTH
jgi:hypothetical protein